MEVVIKQEDLIRMTEEYVKHLGVDLTNMVYSVNFKAGRVRNGKVANPSYAVLSILEKENTFKDPIGTPIPDEVKTELEETVTGEHVIVKEASNEPVEPEKSVDPEIPKEKVIASEDVSKPKKKVKKKSKPKTEPKPDLFAKQETPNHNNLGDLQGESEEVVEPVEEEKEDLMGGDTCLEDEVEDEEFGAMSASTKSLFA